jgi:hypothetical protein
MAARDGALPRSCKGPAGAAAVEGEEAEHAVDGQEREGSVDTHRGAVAAPRPVRRFVTEPGANRVQRQVFRQLEEVRVGLDRHRVESSLEEMTCEAVTSVEGLSVDAVQPLKAARKRRSADLDHKVVVVRHQAVRVKSPVGLRGDGLE